MADNSYYAKKKEESDKKIQAALEARKQRTAPASSVSSDASLAEKRKASDLKIQAALDARNMRIQSSLPNIYSDLQTRYDSVVKSYNDSVSTPLWGKSTTEIYDSQRPNMIETTKLIREFEAYRKYFGDEATDSVLKSLERIKSGQSSIYDNAKIFSQYKSEDEYNKAVEQYKAQQKEEEELLNFDFSDDAYAQIDQRIAELEDEWENYWYDATDTNARKAANKKYDEIQAEIDRLRALPTTAKKYQEQKKQMDYLTGFANSDDFEEYTIRGSELHYEEFGNREWHRSKNRRQRGASTIDNYRAASIALYEHNGNELGYYPDQYEGQINLFRTMKDDEFALLAYFIAKDKDNGTNLAEQYVDSMYETLSARRGAEIADSITGINIPVVEDIAVLGYGVFAGVNDFQTGIDQLFSDKEVPNNPHSYASAYIADSLDGLGYYAYSAATNVGNMVPSILLSSVLTGLGVPAPISEAAGSAVMGLSAAGNAYKDALSKGYDKESARTYGTLVGVSEGVLQYIIGGIGRLGGMSGKFASKIAAIDSSLLRVSAKLGVSIGSEILEEELQNFLEPAFRSIIFGEEYDAPTMDEIIETAIVTALSTGVLEGGGSGINTISTNKNAKNTYGGIQNELVGEALEIDPNNSYAQRMQGRLDKGKDLSGRQLNRLVQQNEQALTAQDMASIQSAAESRLTELGETGDVAAVAKAIAKQAAGEKLTKAEQQILSGSKYGSRVVNELNTENIKSGEYSSEWAQKLDTQRINVEEYSRLVEAAQQPQETTETAGSQVVAETQNVAQAQQAKPVVSPYATVPESRTVENSATGKEFLQVADDDTQAEEISENDTFQKSTGKAVQVKRFSAVGKDATIVTQSGDDVKLSDVSVGNENEAMLLQTIPTFGHITTEAANVILQAYRLGTGNVSSAGFIGAAAHMFKSGYYNSVPSQEYASRLTDTQRDLIYEAGRKAAQEEADAAQAARDKQATTLTKKGGVFRGYEGQRISKNSKNLTKKQRIAVDFTERLAKRFGATVYFYESYVDENGKRVYKAKDGSIKAARKGFYNPKDGSIHIDLNGDNLLFTVSHELVHFIKDWSPAKFRKMADIVMDGFGKQGVTAEELIANKRAEYAEDGIQLTEDEAFEEVIAASLEGIMADGRVMELLQKLEATDKGLKAKVKKFFQDIAQMIRDTIDSYRGVKPDSTEGRLIQKMEDIYSQLQELFAEGLYDAGETFRKTENTTGEGGVRYSLGITEADVQAVQNIGQISVNQFSATAIKATERLARQYWKEMGVKSPFFRAWFGDWRVNDQTPVQIVTKQGDNRSVQRNTDTGWDIQVSGKVFNETKIHTKPYNVAARAYLPYINDIVRNAVLLDSSGVNIGRAKSNNSLLMHSLYAIADIGNGPEIIKLYVEEMNNPNADKTDKRAYQLQNIEKYQLTGKSSQNTASSRSPVTTGTIQTVADLFTAVKQKDSSFQPNPVSKVVNPDGTPKVMYHGSPAQFTIFDKKKAKSSGQYGRGFYFTDSESHANTYGQKYSVYLNIRNPLQYGGSTVTRSQVQKFLESVAENEDYSIENYGSYDVNAVLQTVMGKSSSIDAFQAIQDINTTAIGDMVEAVELFNKVNGTKFDGIVAATETVAFYPEQIKSATDNIGTFDGGNADIRYSVGSKTDKAALDMVEKENAKLREDVAQLKELLRLQGKQTHGTKFTASSVEAAARMLKKNAGAKGDTKALAKMLNGFYEYIAAGEDITWENLREKARPIADWLMDHVEHTRSEYAQEILDQIHGNRIYLDESQMAEAAYRFESYDAYRRSLMGSITIAKDANTSLDSWWREMSSLYPDVFDENISAADMPKELADVIYRLRNEDSSALEYEYNRRFIEQDLIRDIYDSYWRVNNLRTVADRNAAQINKLKSQHFQRVNKLKADNRSSIEQLKEQHRSEVEFLRNAFRQNLEAQYKNLQSEYRKQRKEDVAQLKESAEVTKQRSKVEKQIKSLVTMLAHPTKDLHVPMSLQAPLQEFLESIDFTSKSQKAGYGMTIRDVDYTRALMEVRDAIASQSSAMRGAEDGIYALDIPESFLKEIDKHIKTINSATKGLDLTTNRLYDMNSSELKDLSYILGTINKTIRDIDRLHMAGAKARVSELGKSTVAEMQVRKPVITDEGYRAMWANYTPYYAFRRMGTAAQQIFRGLTQGQGKLAFTQDNILKFARKTFTDKQVQLWEKETHTVKLASGESVTLSTAQLMSFYCLSKRKHAMGHMIGGGIRVESIGQGLKKVIQKETYLLTESDIQNINDVLDEIPDALACAKAMQQYMQDFGGQLINEISMARWDYMAATEQDYFPIKTDDLSRDAKSPDQDRTNLWALLNKSFTKGLTEGANNALVVESIFDVFADHMSECAEYNAFALPLVDAMRWFNYRERLQLDGAQIKDIGVQKSMESALGKASIKYFTDLMTDINSSQKAGRYENFMGRILSRSKVGAVGWNLRVAIQQPTAILRASLILDLPSLAVGTARIGTKEIVAEMQKYSGIALWKSMGYYDLNISRGLQEQIKGNQSVIDKINEAGMWLPGKMDESTWARIWAACKHKVAKEQNLSGESLLKATADLFEDVVYQTQVVDSVLTRSALMRSKSQAVKEATSFLAEGTISYNILLSAYQDYESGKTTWEKAKRGLKIGFYGYVLSSVANALITSLIDAWRDDDEYESFWEKYKQALLGEKSFWDGNLFSELNPLEKIAFVKDFLSSGKGYSASTSYTKFLDNAKDLYQVFGDILSGKKQLNYNTIYKSLQIFSTGSGLGISNFTREVVAIWNNTFGAIYPDKKIHYKDQSTKSKIKNAYIAGALTSEEAMAYLVTDGVVETEDDAYFIVQEWDSDGDYSRYSDVYNAVLNGKDASNAIKELTSHGYTENEVRSQIKTQVGNWYKGGDITKQQAINMLNKYIDMDSKEITATVNKWSCKVVTGIAFEDIKDEFLSGNITAARATDMLVRYGGKSKDAATADVQYWDFKNKHPDTYVEDTWFDTYNEKIASSGISVNVYMDYRNKVSSITGENKKAGRMSVIHSLPISNAQKDALYYAEGWAASKIYEAPWH